MNAQSSAMKNNPTTVPRANTTINLWLANGLKWNRIENEMENGIDRNGMTYSYMHLHKSSGFGWLLQSSCVTHKKQLNWTNDRGNQSKVKWYTQTEWKNTVGITYGRNGQISTSIFIEHNIVCGPFPSFLTYSYIITLYQI